MDGVSDVFKGFGEGVKSILDGVAGVVESFGKSALNAGKGAEHLANGLKTITNLNLGDMTASLAAVALGIGKITKKSAEIDTVGDAESRQCRTDAFH